MNHTNFHIITSFFNWRNSPTAGKGILIYEVSRSHSTTHTVGRTPLNEWPARHRDLYLTTHNTQQQTSMSPVGFEPTI